MRIRNAKQRESGFTLIELMIVVAIIGILAAIAIPNFIRFQLRSRAGEGKVELAALRTAEESYFSEYQTYVTVGSMPNAVGVYGLGGVGSIKQPWDPAQGAQPSADCAPPLPVPAPGHCIIGWMPEGPTYYNYGALATPVALPPAYYASAASDIDNEGTVNVWGYDKSPLGFTGQGSGIAADPQGCSASPGGGPLDMAQNPPVVVSDMVAPCAQMFTQTVF
jgi:type IV pilus assembly protein PilA